MILTEIKYKTICVEEFFKSMLKDLNILENLIEELSCEVNNAIKDYVASFRFFLITQRDNFDDFEKYANFIFKQNKELTNENNKLREIFHQKVIKGEL